MLAPLVRPLAKAGVHPNHLTLGGLALFIAAALLAFTGHWKARHAGVTACGALLDGLDGVLARESGRATAFGAVLDSSCDRLTEIFLLLGVLG